MKPTKLTATTTTPNPHFTNLLQDMQELHVRKNHDYAHDENPYSNFEEAADEAGLTVAEVFAALIGIKNARIRELERAGKTPTNESLMDSYMDRAMYVALDLSYRRMKMAQVEPPLPDFHYLFNHEEEDAIDSYGHGV